MTIKCTAERSNLSPKTIRRQIAAGLLPAHRIGRSIRISEEDFRLFLSQRRG